MADRAAKDALYADFCRAPAPALASGRRAERADLLAQGAAAGRADRREIGQSVANTSHHLRAMARAGLVTTRLTAPASSTRWPATGLPTCGRHLTQVAAVQHAPGLRQLADAYLGSRDGIEVVGRDELAARLARGEVLWRSTHGQPPSTQRATSPGPCSVPVNELRRQLRALPADADVVAYCRGPTGRVCRRGGAAPDPPRVPGPAAGLTDPPTCRPLDHGRQKGQ